MLLLNCRCRCQWEWPPKQLSWQTAWKNTKSASDYRSTWQFLRGFLCFCASITMSQIYPTHDTVFLLKAIHQGNTVHCNKVPPTGVRGGPLKISCPPVLADIGANVTYRGMRKQKLSLFSSKTQSKNQIWSEVCSLISNKFCSIG